MLDATVYRYHPPRLQPNGWPRTISALTEARLPRELATITRDHTHLGVAIGHNAANALDAIARIRRCIAAIRDGYASPAVHEVIEDALHDLRVARSQHRGAIQVAARLAAKAA